MHSRLHAAETTHRFAQSATLLNAFCARRKAAYRDNSKKRQKPHKKTFRQRLRTLGIDTLEGRRLLASQPVIIDNSSPSPLYVQEGNWTTIGPNGYGGSSAYSTAPFTGNNSATWSFNISPGTYRVAATWHGGHPTHASNVPLNIYDGAAFVGSAVLNQRISPNDFLSQSTWWENIGTFSIWDSLQIRTVDIVNGMVGGLRQGQALFSVFR